MPRRKAGYTGTGPASAIGLPDFNPIDSDVLGSSLSLNQHGGESSPIARAVTLNTRASRAGAAPQAGMDVLRGSPLSSAGPGAAPTDVPPPAPPPVQPPTQPPPTFQPPATPPPSPTPSPLPGTGGPYDPSRLNYEGNVYTGPPVQTQGTRVQAPTNDQLREIQRFMDSTGIKIHEDWMKRLSGDPSGYINYLKNLKTVQGNNVKRLADYMEKLLTGASTVTNPDAASQYYDQALYNQALQRQRQGGLSGAREDEETLLANLQSRGLLNSGVAARELSKMREGRNLAYQQAAARLNEILFSNASAQAKQEALTRLQSELESANSERLLRLRYELESGYQRDLHQNDFLSFLTRIGGAIPGALTAGPAGGLRALYGGGGTVTTTDQLPAGGN